MTRNKKRILSIILIILVALITIIISSKGTVAVPDDQNYDFETFIPSEVVDLGSLSQFYANPYIYCLNQGWHFVER